MSVTMKDFLIVAAGLVGIAALVYLGIARRRAKAVTEALILFALAVLMLCLVVYGVMFGANPWGR
jgi:hypothetical protein